VSNAEYHGRWIEAWADTGDLATVSTLPFTPENAVDTYWILPIRQDVSGGSGLDAAGVRAAIGLASANLDTQFSLTATAAELAKVPKSDSNVTWNATALASIQSEANDALVANHLDHLYATSASVNDAGASTTAFNTTLTEANNFWDDAQLTFTSGALAGQSRLILAYANANGGITFDEPLTSAPANGVTFVIKAVHAHSKSQITSDVWNNGTRTLTDKTGFSLSGTQTFNNTGTWTGNIVGTVSTLTTYTGNTPQTGDAYGHLTSAMADSIPSDGTRPSPTQALYMMVQGLFEGSISGTTWTIKKVDGSTTLFTVTLNDATTPTGKTRAT
jgi:hypothetical protein